MSFLPSNLSLHNKRKGEKGPPFPSLPSPSLSKFSGCALDNRKAPIHLGGGETTPLEPCRVVASPVTPSYSNCNG